MENQRKVSERKIKRITSVKVKHIPDSEKNASGSADAKAILPTYN